MNPDNIENMLILYFTGELSEEDSARVEQWMSESAENMELAEQVRSLKRDVDTLQIVESINTKQAYQRFKDSINFQRKSWLTYYSRVAAVLLPLVVVTLAAIMVNVGQKTPNVAQLEFRTSSGCSGTVILPDSTVVKLNSNSVLRYPAQFVGDSRDVELTGEGFFDVMRDEGHQFTVKGADGSRVKVYGTEFNLESYEQSPTVVTLVSGSLGLEYADDRGASKEVRIEPNQRLVYNSRIKEVNVSSTDCRGETAWKDDRIFLDNTSLQEILHYLEKKHNVRFVVLNRNYDGIAFSGGYIFHKSLPQILNYLKLSSGIQWEVMEPDPAQDTVTVIEIK